MQIFNTIYKYNLWLCGSGTGSIEFNNKEYVEFLQNFLDNNHIKSVVDIGCGDWNISKNIDWKNVRYLGIDVVDSVIKNNIEYYSKNNVRFMCKDITDYKNLPNAEVYIIKDVLQHLSFENINKILNNISKKKFKYLIIVNDTTLLNLNLDINDGLYRPLDLQKSPFQLKSPFKIVSYYEKLYIILYILILLGLIYLTMTKKYILYKLYLVLTIFAGILIFPKKNILIYNKLGIK